MLSDKIILAISHLFSFCPFCFPGPNCWAYLSGGVPGVQMGAGISVQLPGGSNRREQFVWGLLVSDGSRVAVPGPRSCTCARRRQNQSLQINNYRHNANLKKLPKLRTAIALIDWTIRIHKCGCFYWTQVRINSVTLSPQLFLRQLIV